MAIIEDAPEGVDLFEDELEEEYDLPEGIQVRQYAVRTLTK